MRLSVSLIATVSLLASVLSIGAPAQIVINEICADNNTTLQDADGESSDWIELRNQSTSLVNLTNYYLTDDPSDLTKWRFPATTLIGNSGRLIIWASGKGRLIGGQRHANFSLSASGEYTALVAPDGITILSEIAPSYPQQYPDVSWGRIEGTNTWGYYTNPTPLTANAALHRSIGTGVTWTPQLPGNNDAITVSATATPRAGATITSANLIYRVGFGGEIVLGMTFSLGQWTATIPASASGPGDMVRWRVLFTDSGGTTTTHPLYPSTTDSPRYHGVMITDPAVTTSMKTLFWFIQNPNGANSTSGTRASVWYDGVLYDNIFCRARGNSSLGWTKKSHKFDFNAGYHLDEPMLGGGVEELNANSTWGDKAFMRQVLSAELYESVGAATSRSFPMRIQRNGSMYSVVNAVEQPDPRYLDRNDLDRHGALYKMFNTLNSSSNGVEKKTRTWEGSSDLATLVFNATQPTGPNLEAWLFDNIDIPACISYLVGTCLMHDNDHVHKNYYLYRDSDGDGEWRFLPWDKDLTWGRNYTLTGGVLNDSMFSNTDPYSHPLFGDQQHPKNDGPWNRLIDALYRTPRIREMYLRRLRTEMDAELSPPGTPTSQLKWENRITQLQAAMAADCALDQAVWGVPSYGSSSLTFMVASNQIRTNYLAPRRVHLFNTHGSTGAGTVPDPFVGPAPLNVTRIEPSTSAPERAYVEFRNCGSQSLDVSDWTITGAINFTFPPGTVILGNDAVFVAADVASFRTRLTSPRGGEGHLVVGPFSGALTLNPTLNVFDTSSNLAANAGDFTFQVATAGSGDASLAVTGATPLAPYWMPISTNTSNPIGCGPVLGLGADAFHTLTLPAGSAPFNGLTDFAGSVLFYAPPGSIPAGLTIDARVVVLNPLTGTWTLSRIQRLTF